MNFFEEASLRLKQQLGVAQDKEAAAMLGLTPRAWAGRKERGAFPTKEIFALAAKKPELGLDVDLIVTGSSTKMTTATTRGTSLLQNFEKLSDRDQVRLLNIAQLWSSEMVLALPPSKEVK
jgi:hypothetical protein